MGWLSVASIPDGDNLTLTDVKSFGILSFSIRTNSATPIRMELPTVVLIRYLQSWSTVKLRYARCETSRVTSIASGSVHGWYGSCRVDEPTICRSSSSNRDVRATGSTKRSSSSRPDATGSVSFKELHLLLTIDFHLQKYRNYLYFRLQSCSSWGCDWVGGRYREN